MAGILPTDEKDKLSFILKSCYGLKLAPNSVIRDIIIILLRALLRQYLVLIRPPVVGVLLVFGCVSCPDLNARVRALPSCAAGHAQWPLFWLSGAARFYSRFTKLRVQFVLKSEGLVFVSAPCLRVCNKLAGTNPDGSIRRHINK